jgi:hypothetical protein
MRERRRAPRHTFVVPVHIDAVDKPGRVGMAENASATGMLIGTQSRFQVGQWLLLRFKPRVEAPWVPVRGRIVRIELDEERELFRRLIAIDFDQPIASE